MVSCPGPGLPIGHAGTRAGVQPHGHASARSQPGGEPGCRGNAGNAQAGGGEPSACLENRPSTASRYMAAWAPDGWPSLPAQALYPAAAACWRAEATAVISAGIDAECPLSAVDCGSPRSPDGGDGAAGSPATQRLRG